MVEVMAVAMGFVVDSARTGSGKQGWDAFVAGWHDRVGMGQALPALTPSTTESFQVRARVGRLEDVTLTDVRVGSGMRTAGLPRHHDHEVRLFAVHRGSLTFDDPDGRGRQVVPAGGFFLQHVRRSVHFETSPGLAAQIVALPADPLVPLLGGRALTGPCTRAEMRLLLAHVTATLNALGELGAAGTRGARAAVLELVKSVVLAHVDPHERATTGALVAAARALADERLTDRQTSSSILAKELNVSLRTLQRAFSEAGEPLSGYIHRRRLEEARRALSATPGLRVSDAAAHWQFTDSSHFVRAFKKQFGGTPTELTRPG